MSSSKVSDKSGKKLKQACLPFKLVNSPGDDANSKGRKRKLSGTENNETRVDDSKVELLNGGTKCFIKSDEDQNNKNLKEISVENVNNEESDQKSDNSVITSAENDVEKTDEEICARDTSKINDKAMEVDDSISISSDSEQIQIDTSINSTSDSGLIEKTTPTSKKPNPKQRQESAKKTEERLRLKQEKEKAREEKLKELAEKQRLKEEKRLAEIEAKRLRELEKEKEKKQREEEKKAKELEKEKERKQKEEERKAKEEERKAKELEKERERKQKEEEKKAKEEERKAKEEERKAKELEKEKLKEEKLLKEESERKKNEKVKAAFVGFFKPKSINLDTSIKDEEIIDKERETYFMPFQTKQDMKMAPFCRANLNSDKKKYVDKCISQCEQKKDLLYLSLLKTGNHKPLKSEATWPISIEDDDDLIVIETGSGSTDDECGVTKIGSGKQNSRKKYRWKLLQFKENKRPPYWGTWRKTSLYIKPKRPLACDKIMFDYEIDSDDEWEEEDPGESIHGTDNEEEPEDDYEVDNDVFVPHGYLSDEEGQHNNNDDSEETQKEKLKLLGEEFEAEIKKKTERIKPKLVGCIWIPNNVTEPKNVSKTVADTLLKYRCIWENEEPIITEAPIIEDSPKDLTVSENKKTSSLPESIMPDLITFIHGNKKYTNIKLAANNFVNEFVKNGQNMDADNAISLSTVKKTIKAIATKSTTTSPWMVKKESFEKYGLEYPKIVEVEIPKPKSSIKKITSFMTPQSQKATVSEKLAMEIDKDVSESNGGLIPKSLFDVKECISPPAKEEQTVKIVGGKKRITPILLSPKKKSKLKADRKSVERSISPEEIVGK